MYLYKVGTQSSVLIKQGVLISEVSFKRGSTVYICWSLFISHNADEICYTDCLHVNQRPLHVWYAQTQSSQWTICLLQQVAQPLKTKSLQLQ